MLARRGRPWLDFVESEKETEMSERAKSQKKEHSETYVCLSMALREMLGQCLLNDVAYFRPQIDFN